VRKCHPWIFSGAVDRVEGFPLSGETVEVFTLQREFLGRAAYSPQSNIRARMWTWEIEEQVGLSFFRQKLVDAIQMRRDLIPEQETQSLRLVHAESDGLPGVIVDQYGDTLVLQVLTAGAEIWRDNLADLLAEITGIKHIYERSDVDIRHLEGLPQRCGMLRGNPAETVLIKENGLKFMVNIARGQKTGFFLDQRRNRERVRQMVMGRKVLNCFCYTGAFSVYALAGGAGELLSIDSSAEALEMAKENTKINGFLSDQSSWLEGDVFIELRKLRDRGETFDAIILDPPKFAPTIAHAEKAARAYKDINLLAFKMLRPGGLLFTFSCSGGISADYFQKIVAGAAVDARTDVKIIEVLSQGLDHPIRLNFPEGAYLKGLICYKEK